MKYTYKLLVILLMLPVLLSAQEFSRIDLIPGDDYVLTGIGTPNGTTEFNNKLYFTGQTDTLAGLWCTDGTTAGTDFIHMLTTYAQSPPVIIFAWNDKICISARKIYGPDTTGVELYVSDGTTSGLELLKNICIDNCSGWPYLFTPLDNELLFNARQGSEVEDISLFKTDGTTPGTVVVSDVIPFFLTYNPADNKVYFSGEDDASGAELWITDGTTQGTMMVEDIVPGNQGSSPLHLTAYNGKIYFAASNSGNHLFVSDGTAAGTKILKTITQETGSWPKGFTVHNDLLYFAASNENGNELWVSDGTEAGTVMVKDINPGDEDALQEPFSMAGSGNYLYFTANDGLHGFELWKTDGSEANTQMVKDIYPGAEGSGMYNLINYTEHVYFSATDNGAGYKLFESDGTENGTVVIHPEGAVNEYPFQIAFQFSAVVFQEGLFFTADFDSTGPKLWRYGAEITAGPEIPANGQVRVYPNPAKGHFNIVMEKAYETLSVEVYNTTGTRMQSHNFRNTGHTSLDLTGYSNGIYFLVFKTKHGSFSRKIIKH